MGDWQGPLLIGTVPTVFKTAVVTASGTTTVWTPASGKRFRLLGYEIATTDNCQADAAAILEITLVDGSTPLGVGMSVYVPATAATNFGPLDRMSHQIGAGYRSLAAGNALGVNLSFALTAGKLRVNVYGTEE